MPMNKVALIAPDGVRGTIHASDSGASYTIDGDGIVIVEHVDVRSLIGAGYQHKPRDTSETDRPEDQPIIESEVPGSMDRETARLAPVETDQQSSDFGGARPPHGLPSEVKSTERTRADAREEVDQRERVGADPALTSRDAPTGHDAHLKANADDQAAAAEGERGDGKGQGQGGDPDKGDPQKDRPDEARDGLNKGTVAGKGAGKDGAGKS